VQGDGAPASIVAAIERVELDGRAGAASIGGGALRSWLALMMNDGERLLIVRSQ